MEMCVSYTNITGNVKSKCIHNMITGIARISQQGATARERSDRVGEWWGNFLHINLFLFTVTPATSMGGGGAAWALVPPYSYASDSGVARIC